MIGHRIAYSIDHHAGCHGAGLQAAATSDRPLCATVSAYAAWRAGKPIRGTITGQPDPVVKKHFLDEFGRMQVDLFRVGLWARGMLGDKLDASKAPDSAGGLQLDAYQRAVIARTPCSGGVYSLDCGLGKTLTAIAAVIAAVRNGECGSARCWVVCPLNAFGAWRRFEADLKAVFADVAIMSVDSMHKLTAAENTGGAIIFDECHYLGHTTARRTKACHKIRSRFDFALCLTGTLLHGGVENALSILDLATPGAALFASRWKAGEHFSCLAVKRLGPRTVTSIEKPTGANHKLFVEWISRFVIALKKDNPEVKIAFQLPEQHIHDVRLAEPWESIDDAAVAVALADLKATGEMPHMQKVAHLLCRSEAEAKVDWFMDMLGDDRTTQCVVFANYLETLNLLEAELKNAGIRYVRVDGAVTGDARIAAQYDFQRGQAQIFMGQQLAASISMDLFAAQVSVCLDHSWKAADYTQMLARTCRRGQNHETHHFDLCSNRLQDLVVRRVRAAQTFDASVAEYQSAKAALSFIPQPTP